MKYVPLCATSDFVQGAIELSDRFRFVDQGGVTMSFDQLKIPRCNS
jgi:hypothetical protein